MTLEQFIAEIRTSFSNYTDSINDISIKRWIINELKLFGNDITTLKESIIQIENSTGQLPDYYRGLKLALKVEPFARVIKGNCKDFENSYIYKRRIEHPAYFNEVTQEYITDCRTKIVEDVIKINNSTAHFYYNNPQWLSLTPNIKKDSVGVGCLNLHPSIRNSYPNEFSITQSTINTNFSEGNIYMQCYALQTDEDGEIIIPETKIGALEKYLEYYVKSKIAEDIMANNLNPLGLTQLLPMYLANASEFKKTALTESRWSGISDNKWVKNFKSMNMADMAKYNFNIR